MQCETQPTPMERVIRIMGSQRKLARQLGVTDEAVRKWKSKVPAERVLAIEGAVLGEVTRHELRPDLYPADRA